MKCTVWRAAHWEVLPLLSFRVTPEWRCNAFRWVGANILYGNICKSGSEFFFSQRVIRHTREVISIAWEKRLCRGNCRILSHLFMHITCNFQICQAWSSYVLFPLGRLLLCTLSLWLAWSCHFQFMTGSSGHIIIWYPIVRHLLSNKT